MNINVCRMHTSHGEIVSEQSCTMFPLSDLQRSLYFINQCQLEQAIAYHVPLVLEMDGQINVDALSKSIDYLIKRHSLLRTVFCEREKTVTQAVVEAVSPIKLSVEQIEAAHVHPNVHSVVSQRFQLDQWPLLRVKLFQLAPNKHLLIIVQPHIITDGWSLNVLKKELFQTYAALIKGAQPNLPNVNLTYFEYIDSKKNTVQKERVLSDLEYWKKKLEAFQPLNFPYDKARLEHIDCSGKRLPFSIEQTLYKKIVDFSALHNVTPFMCVLSVLNVLLARYCYQEDIVIGFPVSGRDTSDVENTLGPFVNTLIARNRVLSDERFIELLTRVKANCLEAYAHQQVSFNELVNRLDVKRESGVNPIFQVVLAWQDWHEATIKPTNTLTVTSKHVDLQCAKFDLTFEIIPHSNGLEGFIEYNTNLFVPETVKRLSECFIELIRQCVMCPEKSLSEISFSESALMHLAYIPQRLTQFDKSEALLTPCQVFEQHAQKTPSKIALFSETQKVTYAELNEQANQLARYIKEKQEQLSSPTTSGQFIVGLYLEKGFNTIISILAILKAGAAYVPIDTRSPAKRVENIISDASCVLIITEAQCKQYLNGVQEQLICLEDDKAKFAKYSSVNLGQHSQPNELMYIIYTSGTTGKPKGVMQTHFNVARLFKVTERIFHFSASDTGLFFHSHAFDFSVWEIWGTLMYGARLVVPSQSDIVDPYRIYQLIKMHRVTVFNQTPSAFQGFMQVVKSQKGEALPLRYIVFGGEALDVKQLADWWAHYRDDEPTLVNMYGITETAVHTTYKILSREDLKRRERSNIGVPLDDMHIVVVDKHLNPLPVGMPGELLVGGHGLAMGYMNRPELTQEKFIEYIDVKTGKKARMYRTGDLVRYLFDGNLEYLGRIDKQIKFKGFRIETEAIESALRCHKEIMQCAVVIKQADDDTKKLVAYYVLRENSSEEVNALSLNLFLSETLPEYMIPNLFVKVDSIPLTDNMKINYEALPSIEGYTVEIKKRSEEPLTTQQKRLAEIWEKVLCISGVGLDDNFFGIGGDSITCLRIVSDARKVGFAFDVNDIFKYQTIRAIIQNVGNIDRTLEEEVPTDFALLNETDREQLPKYSVDAYPIASLQLGMIYHTLHSPENAVYIDIFCYRISAKYQKALFLQAFQTLVDAHPILRTTFHLSSYSVPLQIVHKQSVCSVTTEDLSELTGDAQEEALEKWMSLKKHTVVNFETGPLFEATVHILSETEFELGLVFHHALLDGWSVATLVTKLLSIYAKQLRGENVHLEVNKHYRDFIQLEQRALCTESQKSFWKNELVNFDYTHIFPWGDEQNVKSTFVSYPVAFKRELTEQLTALSKALKVSIDILCLTGFLKLLSILTTREDILAGVVFNGRPSTEEAEETLGLFLNALPFRQQLSGKSWKDLIVQVADKKTELYPHRCYPLMQIQRDMNVEKLFDMVFYFTHFHVYEQVKALNPVEIIGQRFYERTNFPLTFNCTLDALNNRLRLFINYETQHFSANQVSKMVDYFSSILETMVSSPDADHQLFDVLSKEERHLILSDWNQTETEYNFERPLNDWLSEQTHKTPYQPAVLCNDTQLTYQGLNNNANALAAYLKEQGACPGEPIVLYQQRSVESIVAILAIFKLGCVYVPIDTVQPAERVEYILNEVRCRFILSDALMIESNTLSKPFQDKLLNISAILETNDSKRAEDFCAYAAKNTDIAYILYTSGSTGNPKGVMVHHKALLNFLFFMKKMIHLSPEDRLLALTSFSFDISLLEVFLPLLNGAACILADQDQKIDPSWIIHTIQQKNVTCVQATPTAWKMLFDVGFSLTPSMKVLCGGETLTSALANQLKRSQYAWNVYGPTETTIWSTHYSLNSMGTGTGARTTPTCIGKPIANTKVYVLDHCQKPVPIGAPGELYIAGAGVAVGYLGNERLSAERFIANPFEATDGTYSKMYKTGDLVRWLANGTLCFMGRLDQQCKVRGFRIERGDIEAALLKHPAIKASVVIVKKVSEMDNLIAYVVWKNSKEPLTTKALRAFLMKKLPYYMLPDMFVSIDRIPMNVGGKIDIRALSVQGVKNQQIGTDEVRLTQDQKRLAAIWSQVLNVSSIQLEDNFYDLGGNSISSLVVVNKINETFNVHLAIRDFIEHADFIKLYNQIITLQSGAQNKEGVQKKPYVEFIKRVPDPMIALRTEGRLKPLFLIHPVGGTVFYYMPLVKHLISDRPVYAIQDPGIETQETLFSTLSEMVEFYIKVIKRYQNCGPYYIAGSSFGANATVEMACQLMQQGEEVAFVGSIDGWARYPDKANNDRQWFENNLKRQINAIGGLMKSDIVIELFADIHWHRQQLLAQHKLLSNMSIDLTLFKAQETMDVLKPLESHYNNWDKYCNLRPTVYTVPGDHFTMNFEPNVQTLARVFDERLNKVEKSIS